MRINYGVLVQKPIFEDLISWFGNGLIMFLVFFSHSNIILSYPINIGSTFGLMSNDTQRVAWIILDLSGLQWLDQVVEWSARLWIYRLWRSAQELLSIESIFFDYSDDYLINPVYWSFCIIFFLYFSCVSFCCLDSGKFFAQTMCISSKNAKNPRRKDVWSWHLPATGTICTLGCVDRNLNSDVWMNPDSAWSKNDDPIPWSDATVRWCHVCWCGKYIYI